MPRDPKAYRKVKQTARKAGRAAKKEIKGTAKTYVRGAKLASRGEKQLSRARTASSKEVSKSRKKGTLTGPKQSTRYKAMDAQVKIDSGKKMMANPKPKMKGKKKVYREAPAAGYGPNVYVNKKGQRVTRKKRR